MSVYRRGALWHYDFWFQGRRHLSPIGLESADEAHEAEAALKRTLRRRAAGLEALDARDTPRFSDWAGVTWAYQRDHKRIKRPDEAKQTLRLVLAFWGASPTREPPVTGGVYRDLRLGDPIAQPELIGSFDDWMTARGLSPARKNHYWSACSMLYRVALLPRHRRRSGVRENPFRHVERGRVRRRTVVLEPVELERWIGAADIPVLIAVMVGAAAPTLRLANVVEMTRGHLAADRWSITVSAHKTDRGIGDPLVIPLWPGLRRFIQQVEAAYPDDRYLVPLRVGPRRHRTPPRDGGQSGRYWQLVRRVKTSIQAAGLPYGRRDPRGVTFHALRHTLGTWLARSGASQHARQAALGHATAAMSDWYRHLAGTDRAEAMRLVGDQLSTIVTVAERRLAALTRPAGVPPEQQISVPHAGAQSGGAASTSPDEIEPE